MISNTHKKLLSFLASLSLLVLFTQSLLAYAENSGLISDTQHCVEHANKNSEKSSNETTGTTDCHICLLSSLNLTPTDLSIIPCHLIEPFLASSLSILLEEHLQVIEQPPRFI